MCCIMGESQGMFSGRTWRWVSNPDPHPHPISILVPCDLHGAPQWHGSGPTTLSVMAHVYRGMHVLHDASQWHVQLPHMALGVPAYSGPTTCMLFFHSGMAGAKAREPSGTPTRAQCSIPWGHRCRRSGSSFSSSLCPCLCLCPAAGSSESFQGSTCQFLFQALTRIVVINPPWTHRPMPRSHGVVWYTDTPTHWCWFGLHPTIALTLILP